MCQLVVLRSAVAGDLATVAAMNQRLVEDQGSRNPFSSVEYQQRLKDWLAGDEWEIALFIDPNGDILGYAVYKVQGDYYYPDQEVVYLRQFFIDRPHRGQGAGSAAYQLLANERFLGREVCLDVLATNPRGKRFWHKLGFEEYFVSMKKV